MEDIEISWMVKTSSTFGAKCAKQTQNFFPHMLFLKIDLIDRGANSEISPMSLASHMSFVTKYRMIDRYSQE